MMIFSHYLLLRSIKRVEFKATYSHLARKSSSHEKASSKLALKLAFFSSMM
jgi:hypothetical protein